MPFRPHLRVSSSGSFTKKSLRWVVYPPQGHDRITSVSFDLVPRRALGIERLLRAMRDHPQYTVADSLALCQGYAPFSRISAEGSA